MATIKEEAIKLHHQQWTEIESSPDDWTVVYCDGSERDGHVGMAAKIMHPGQEQISFYIGDSSISAIYGAELYGIGSALWLAIRHSPLGRKMVIFTDNQSAVQNLRNPNNRSSQQYALNII